MEANKLAQELLKENYNFENLMRIQQTVNSSETRLAYAYKARTVAQDDNQIMEANAVIADIEQAKLDKSCIKVVFFCKNFKMGGY